MSDLDQEREARVHAVFESLRALKIDVSDDFIDRLVARVRQEGQFRGPSLGRIAGGLLSQLANLAVGTVSSDAKSPEKETTDQEDE